MNLLRVVAGATGHPLPFRVARPGVHQRSTCQSTKDGRRVPPIEAHRARQRRLRRCGSKAERAAVAVPRAGAFGHGRTRHGHNLYRARLPSLEAVSRSRHLVSIHRPDCVIVQLATSALVCGVLVPDRPRRASRPSRDRAAEKADALHLNSDNKDTTTNNRNRLLRRGSTLLRHG